MASNSEKQKGSLAKAAASISWRKNSDKTRTRHPNLVRLLLAAFIAVGLAVLSHLLDFRVHGANGDLVIVLPAFLGLYLLLGRFSFNRPRNQLERLASRWLQIRQRNPAAVDGTATVCCAVLLVGCMHAAGLQPHGIGGEAMVAIAASLIAYLLISQINNLMVGALVRKVHSIGAVAHGAARPTILSFVDRHLERLDDQLEAILSRAGALLDVEDVKFWTEQCFAFGEGRYDGTDSHVPSDFIRLYPSYLKAHGAMLDAHPSAPKNTRILIGPHGDFRDDYIERYELGYSDFLDWHDKKVSLLHLERERAEQLRKELGKEQRDRTPLPTVDLGVWHGQYAVLFREEVKDGISKIRLWMVFPGDDWYTQCETLVQRIKQGKTNGKEYPPADTLASAVPEIFERELCRQWEGFVDTEKRMEKLGPFFEHILGKNRAGSVLDAAAGIGSDALWLADRGFNVTLNEIEPVYREIIEDRFRSHGRPLYLFAEDWRKLPESMGQWFTTVLVLGNSLCLLRTPEQQKQAVEAFYKVLAPGGTLIIDERNFTHFTETDVAERIRHNPIRNFPYAGNIMYCGNAVKGCPRSIGKTDVVFRYYRNDESFTRSMMGTKELDEPQRKALDEREIGSLHLYPFSKGELGTLLLDCHFEDVTAYRDLDWRQPFSFNGTDDQWFDRDADFFVYVATKKGN
jgi:SAM-dependent methyltransferase